MKEILIFGAGGHAKVIFSEIIQLKKYLVLGFVDDFAEKNKVILVYENKKYVNIGKTEDIKNYNKICGVIGVGENYLRKKICEEINKKFQKFKWESIISKNSIINGNVSIGKGSVILSNSVINTGTKIENHCLINTSSSIDHDNHFKNFSSTGPGTITGGNVTIGETSHLGIGSKIKQQINIGKNTIIGGNSFVNKNCEDNSVYYGIPAKKVKDRSFDDKYL